MCDKCALWAIIGVLIMAMVAVVIVVSNETRDIKRGYTELGGIKYNLVQVNK